MTQTIIAELKFGSLFAGLGGFDRGFARAGMECAWQVEIDDNCQNILRRHHPNAKRLRDIRQVGARNLSRVDVICGGFPCQDLSVAGARAGLTGARSGLFFEMARVAYELQPTYLVWENVPGLLSSCSCGRCRRRCARCEAIAGAADETCEVCGGDEFLGKILRNHRGADFFAVVSTLGEIGFDGAWRILDARHFGVPQRRRRLFGVFVNRRARIVRRLEKAPPAQRDARLADLYSALLLESDGVLGHPAAIRTPGQAVAAPLTRGSAKSRGVNAPGRRREDDENLVAAPLKASSPARRNGGSEPIVGEFVVANPLGSHQPRYDLDHETYVAGPLHSGTPSRDATDAANGHLIAFTVRPAGYVKRDGADNLVVQPLRSGRQFSDMGDGQSNVVVFNATGSSTARDNPSSEHVAALRGKEHLALAFAWQQGTSPKGGRECIVRSGDYAGSVGATRQDAVSSPEIGVRRLTPVECERLQGLDDDWTAWGLDEQGQRVKMSDTARYQMCGNAVCTAVSEWIGKRIVNVARTF